MKTVLGTIGDTPLLRIGSVYAKLEMFNPSGSIKDRIALFMVEQAEKRSELRAGFMIIEASSGNTGIAFALIATIKKYKMIVVMPENVGKEKRRLIKALGAEIVLTPKKRGFNGAIRRTEELAQKYRNSWLPKQFENFDNVNAYEVLAKEILKQTGKVDAFVAGIGTGGTLMGVSKILKKRFPRIKIVGVEAVECFGKHKIGGISDGITPRILDFDLVDEIIKIKSKNAILTTKKLIKENGLFVGVSSGANLLAATKIAIKHNLNNVITVLPDRTERYPFLW